MSNHLDEMKFFLDVAKSYATETLLESYAIQATVEKPLEITEQVLEESFIKDLQDLKESWLSLNSTNADQNYALGYEQGLYKAVEMLENLLSSKYNRRI